MATKTSSVKKKPGGKHSQEPEDSESIVSVSEPTIVIPDNQKVTSEETPGGSSTPAQPSVPAASSAPAAATADTAGQLTPSSPAKAEDPMIIQKDLPPIGELSDADDFEPEHKSSSFTLILIFIIALILGAGIAGGVFYFFNPFEMKPPSLPADDQTAMESPVPPATDTTPEATDSADTTTVNLAEYDIQVLNGSGVAGAAGNARDLLLAAGFEKFTVGNAGEYEHTATEVQMKEGAPAAVYTAIEKTLTEGGYTVTEGDTLTSDADYDVIVIVGTKS
ncbi:MAG TPA: LytR C-terminal domain-containing protein [Patescibacteria group bacterium]|nr:LytR C-terminal domain-containing protein [Patescibacteria group bacterium]